MFTGKYPRGLFDFQVGVIRWDFRVSCWVIGLTDKYPPFTLKSTDHPADLAFQHQEKSSRLWALLTIIPIKILAILPHFFVLMFLGIIVMFAGILGVFAVLFTGKYPQSFENFVIGFYRWQWRLTAYYSCITDKYPPFTMKEADYPAALTFEHQEKSSRLWALLTIIPVKILVLLPHIIVLAFMQIAMSICILLGLFGTLFVGRYPKSFEKVIVATYKYILTINTYLFCLTDKYPPFPWKDEAPATPGSTETQAEESIEAGESV